MNSLNPVIKLRGHHLICLHFFSGEGYNPEFISNLREIIKQVEAGGDIEVYPGPDDVCKKCPNLKEERCLYDQNSEDGIKKMDIKAIKLLKMEPNIRVKWIDIIEKIPEIFNEWSIEYCNNCYWRKVCEKAAEYQKMKRVCL